MKAKTEGSGKVHSAEESLLGRQQVFWKSGWQRAGYSKEVEEYQLQLTILPTTHLGLKVLAHLFTHSFLLE